jgi:hypothetical protein
LSELHPHYCPRCNELYDCTADRPIDASEHGGPEESVCFHHYGVPHDTCVLEGELATVVVGGY